MVDGQEINAPVPERQRPDVLDILERLKLRGRKIEEQMQPAPSKVLGVVLRLKETDLPYVRLARTGCPMVGGIGLEDRGAALRALVLVRSAPHGVLREVGIVGPLGAPFG